MKKMSTSLAAHLAGGVTTLATCWKIQRSDGVVLGFTECDVNLTFDGVTYEAAAGMNAGTMESSSGLAIDNLDVSGALQSARLTERDLAAGIYDNADVEIWRVNWQDVTERILMRKGTIGEVTRGSSAFQAEIRGLSHTLNQSTGRVHQYGCDAVLGDARCGVNISVSPWLATGTVGSVEGNRVLTVSGLSSFEGGFFSRGLLMFSSGENAGRACEVKTHVLRGSTVLVELWQAAAEPVSPDDSFSICAGCDGQFETCRNKFSNQINFRGFPHMPGNDFVQSFPTSGGNNDGGSRNG